MTKNEFNLISEPWIKVLTLDGEGVEISISEALKNSISYGELACELPTMNFAILRILLAIVHRAYGNNITTKKWKELWDKKELDLVDSYLSEWSHRFNLIDDEAPFFQTPTLRTRKNEMTSTARVISNFNENKPHHVARFRSSLDNISYSEAARWLIHCQAYDTSGIKTGAVGDPEVSQGKGKSKGVAWSGHLGAVVPLGRNLMETILLNLVPSNLSSTDFSESDIPAWEKPVTTALRNESGVAAGPIDLYTWQSRRVRLSVNREKGVIDGSLVSNGDTLTPQNKHRIETHSQWRYSKNQTKEFGYPVFMTESFAPGRQAWRGVNQYLVEYVDQPTEDAPPAPAVMVGLQGPLLDIIGYDYPLRISTVGIEYGSKSSVIGDISDDSVSVPPVAISSAGRGSSISMDTPKEGVKIVDDLVRAYVNCVIVKYKALPLHPDVLKQKRSAFFSQGYDLVDNEVRIWLFSLESFDSHKAALSHLAERVGDMIFKSAEDEARTAPPAIWLRGDPSDPDTPKDPADSLGLLEYRIKTIQSSI